MISSIFENSYDYLCDTFHFGEMPGNSITLNFTLESEPIEESEKNIGTIKCQSQLIDKRKDNC